MREDRNTEFCFTFVWLSLFVMAIVLLCSGCRSAQSDINVNVYGNADNPQVSGGYSLTIHHK